jgi:hypothetical protein
VEFRNQYAVGDEVVDNANCAWNAATRSSGLPDELVERLRRLEKNADALAGFGLRQEKNQLLRAILAWQESISHDHAKPAETRDSEWEQ